MENDIAKRFHALAEQWKKETCYLSSVTAMARHPAHQEIVAMGKAAIPLILKELEKEPDHWFVALNAISGEDPALPGDTFDQACRAWLRWGKRKGYLK